MTENQLINDKVLTGTFEGQYLDAYGYRGRLRIDIQSVKEGQLLGSYELVLASEDKPQTISGRVLGIQEHGTVKLSLVFGEDIKEQGDLAYTAELQNAGSYAKQCIFGVVKAPSRSGLGGGVWIAWQFAERGL